MTRPLVSVDARDPEAVLEALRLALSGAGPAVLPRDGASVGLGDVARPVALVIETSGSTGVAKRVALTADALLAGAAATDTALGGPGQWILALPVSYIAGVQVLVRSLAAETRPIVLPRDHFDPARFVAAVGELTAEQRRYSALVPAQLGRLLDLAEDGLATNDLAAAEALRSLHGILVGGQSLPTPLRDRALRLGLRIRTTYGSSETSGGCVYDGIPLPGVQLRLLDGELQVAGPMLASGYLGDPARTAERFVHDAGTPWYRTGDAAELGDGTVRILGRLDNVVISGGVKVSLDVVERRVRELPGLGDAVVVAADDPRWGQVPVLASAVPADLEAVRAAVQETLGAAARPARLVLLDPLPLLPSGKPDRRRITGVVAEGAAPA